MVTDKQSNRRPLVRKAADKLDALKYEVAEDLNLDDDIANRGWENMTTREVGKIGGHMVKKMLHFAEKKMRRR
ncbi:MAG: alpha/beta-type small acid-soluble spore protein [Firmicutes bacterium]|jgi:small acid-soluble spore protein F (minor alpha/beta-type SASP)|nr:alpha/beta-type small acid-soluble spore protein [Bacillota bacterium]